MNNSEYLTSEIQINTVRLLDLAKEITWNSVDYQPRITYLVREINKDFEDRIDDFEHMRKIRNLELRTVNEISLDGVVDLIDRRIQDVFSIELFPYKFKRSKVIIEVQIINKDILEEGYRKKMENNLPMVSCKINQPNYIQTTRGKKFDVNWELGTTEYLWNRFLNIIRDFNFLAAK